MAKRRADMGIASSAEMAQMEEHAHIECGGGGGGMVVGDGVETPLKPLAIQATTPARGGDVQLQLGAGEMAPHPSIAQSLSVEIVKVNAPSASAAAATVAAAAEGGAAGVMFERAGESATNPLLHEKQQQQQQQQQQQAQSSGSWRGLRPAHVDGTAAAVVASVPHPSATEAAAAAPSPPRAPPTTTTTKALLKRQSEAGDSWVANDGSPMQQHAAAAASASASSSDSSRLLSSRPSLRNASAPLSPSRQSSPMPATLPSPTQSTIPSTAASVAATAAPATTALEAPSTVIKLSSGTHGALQRLGDASQRGLQLARVDGMRARADDVDRECSRRLGDWESTVGGGSPGDAEGATSTAAAAAVAGGSPFGGVTGTEPTAQYAAAASRSTVAPGYPTLIPLRSPGGQPSSAVNAAFASPNYHPHSPTDTLALVSGLHSGHTPVNVIPGTLLFAAATAGAGANNSVAEDGSALVSPPRVFPAIGGGGGGLAAHMAGMRQPHTVRAAGVVPLNSVGRSSTNSSGMGAGGSGASWAPPLATAAAGPMSARAEGSGGGGVGGSNYLQRAQQKQQHGGAIGATLSSDVGTAVAAATIHGDPIVASSPAAAAGVASTLLASQPPAAAAAPPTPATTSAFARPTSGKSGGMWRPQSAAKPPAGVTSIAVPVAGHPL